MASPYGLDLPGDFDEDQAAIDRRKLQLIAAMKTPIGGAGSGLIGGIGNFLQNAVGTNLLSGQDDLAKQLAGRRADYAKQALTRLGNRDTPAQPEFQAQIPQQPIVDDEGNPMPSPDGSGPMGGMVPQGPQAVYKPATPFLPGKLSDKLGDISDLAAGGPVYAKAAEKLLSHALDKEKGGADKWEIKTLTRNGLEQDFWVNMNNPSQKPIPAGEGKPNQPKALQQLYDMHKQYVDADPSTRDKPEAERAQIARGLTVKAADIKIDPVTGEIVITSKPAAVAQITGGTPPATQGGGTQPLPAAKPPGQVPRNEKVLAVLEPQIAEVLASPDSPQRNQNLRELDDASKRAGGPGVPGGAPPPNAGITDPDPANRPLGPGLKSAKQYRAEDPRNAQYLQQESVPGLVTRTGGMPVKAKELNDDVEKLSVRYGKEKLTELIPAVNQIEATIADLAKKDPRIKQDAKTGKWTGEAPGYGGFGGIMNVVPSVLVGENGVAMRNAMSVVNDIKLSERSGAAVVTQELERYRTEMAQNLGSNDKLFWDAYHNFKDRLSKIESGVTGGYAPIVRDSFVSRENAVIPMWSRGGGSSAPTEPPPKVVRNAADYNALNVGDAYIAPDGRVDTKKARK